MTKDGFLASNRKFEVVSDGLAEPVHVWRMSAAKRIAFDALLSAKATPGDLGVFLVSACVGDASGPFGMTLDEAGAVDFQAVARLAEVALKVNRLSAEDAEEERKNSSSDPG